MNIELYNRALRRCEEIKGKYRMILLDCVQEDRRVAELAQEKIVLYARAMYRLEAKLTSTTCLDTNSRDERRDRAGARKRLAALFARSSRV